MTPAASIVVSNIVHVRYRPTSHRLHYKGLSLWLDLDRLEEADSQSSLFSVGRWNLLSFDERDHGPNFTSGRRMVESLAHYARRLAKDVSPGRAVDRVMLLTFPRILGWTFNPISVYRCLDPEGNPVATVYEVRNTFGEMHSYVGGRELLHQAGKVFHVSPFLPTRGHYRLKMRHDGSGMSLAVRYTVDGDDVLTATLRGEASRLGSMGLLGALFRTGQFPGRPLLSIHLEAIKLFLKKVPLFPRPAPPEVLCTQAREKVTD